MKINDPQGVSGAQALLNLLKNKPGMIQDTQAQVTDYINNSLTPEQAGKLKSILENKEATDALLATPEAKKLMKYLIGGNSDEQ